MPGGGLFRAEWLGSYGSWRSSLSLLGSGKGHSGGGPGAEARPPLIRQVGVRRCVANSSTQILHREEQPRCFCLENSKERQNQGTSNTECTVTAAFTIPKICCGRKTSRWVCRPCVMMPETVKYWGNLPRRVALGFITVGHPPVPVHRAWGSALISDSTAHGPFSPGSQGKGPG